MFMERLISLHLMYWSVLEHKAFHTVEKGLPQTNCLRKERTRILKKVSVYMQK